MPKFELYAASQTRGRPSRVWLAARTFAFVLLWVWIFAWGGLALLGG